MSKNTGIIFSGNNVNFNVTVWSIIVSNRIEDHHTSLRYKPRQNIGWLHVLLTHEKLHTFLNIIYYLTPFTNVTSATYVTYFINLQSRVLFRHYVADCRPSF